MRLVINSDAARCGLILPPTALPKLEIPGVFLRFGALPDDKIGRTSLGRD